MIDYEKALNIIAQQRFPLLHTSSLPLAECLDHRLASHLYARIPLADVAVDTPLLKAGTQLNAERIMVAAAFGYPRLTVETRPRLALFSWGSGFVEPGEDLSPDAMYDANKYFLRGAAAATGLAVLPYQRISDQPAKAKALVESCLQDGHPTVIISTAADSTARDSAGELDFIPDLGAQLGFDALFHEVAVESGKPLYLAKKDNCLWLSLPENSVSICVGWHMFVRPLLAACAGLPAPQRQLVSLSNEVTKPELLRCFYRAELSGDKAWVSRRQGSAQLTASIGAQAYVELPEGKARFSADTKVMATLI